jgi:hypothetical protein
MLRVRRFALLVFQVGLYDMWDLAPVLLGGNPRARQGGGDFARDALGCEWGDPPLKRD